MIHERIRVPAAKLWQRVYRGHRGRVKATRKRLERDSAINIQKKVRGFVKRCWLARVKLWKKKHAAATLLSSWMRGVLDREIVRLRREKEYHLKIEVPSCVTVQSHYRGHAVREAMKVRRTNWIAAMDLQGFWRKCAAKMEYRRRWEAQLARCAAPLAVRELFSASRHYAS